MCGSVAEWLGCWTCDQQVASSSPGLSAIECNPGQVVNTHVPLSPNSIIWYQPTGGDRTGHASQTLVDLHLWAQGLEEGDEHPPTLSCGAWLTLPFFNFSGNRLSSIPRLKCVCVLKLWIQTYWLLFSQCSEIAVKMKCIVCCNCLAEQTVSGRKTNNAGRVNADLILNHMGWGNLYDEFAFFFHSVNDSLWGIKRSYNVPKLLLDFCMDRTYFIHRDKPKHGLKTEHCGAQQG